MKKNFLIMILLVLSTQYICCANNIYEDAINHFIEEIVNRIELTNIKATNDSVYHHTLIFESNYSLNDRIPDSVNGYKIVQITNIKEYIDTCKVGWIPIFTIDKIDYCEECFVPFGIDFEEFIIKKDLDGINIIAANLHIITYDYNSKSKKFIYRYCNSSSGGREVAKKIIKRKGWCDDFIR